MAARDVTRGDIAPLLRSLWWPVLVAMLMQTAYALVNLAFVRSLGDAAIGAIGIGHQAFFIILALGQMVGATARADVSQAFGRGDVLGARRRFTFYALVAAGVGLVAALGAFLGAEAYVGALTGDPATYRAGLDYFRASAPTFLFQLVVIVFAGSMRATGDFIVPMIIMVASVVLNAILDAVFIFGLGPIAPMGVAGAAWATVIAQGLSTVAYVVRLTRARRHPRALAWAAPTGTRTAALRIVTRGLPAGLQFFAISAVTAMVLAGVKDLGVVWTGAASGGFRLAQQASLPIITLAMAVAAFAGQNVGARLGERVRRGAVIALRWGLLYGVVAGGLLALLATQIAPLGADSDDQVALVADYLRIAAPGFIATALVFVPAFVLQAAGHMVAPMFAALVRVAVIAVIIYGVRPLLGLGPAWIFASATVASFIEAAVALYFLRRFLRGLPSAEPVVVAAAPLPPIVRPPGVTDVS